MMFGEYLVKNGALTQDQVDEALTVQQKMSSESGKKKLIGEIVIDLGYAAKENIEQMLIKYFKED